MANTVAEEVQAGELQMKGSNHSSPFKAYYQPTTTTDAPGPPLTPYLSLPALPLYPPHRIHSTLLSNPIDPVLELQTTVRYARFATTPNQLARVDPAAMVRYSRRQRQGRPDLPRPMSLLPIEVIEHIIRLSLPPFHTNTMHERVSVLLSYSLVSSLWRGLAQRELFACPIIRSKIAAGNLWNALRDRSDLRAKVKALRFDADAREGGSMMRIRELCGACLGLEELIIENVHGLSARWLSGLKGLQKMELYNVSFNPDVQHFHFHFPLLRELTWSISDLKLMSHLLAPNTLPSLRVLYFDGLGGSFDHQPFLSSFVSQLDSMTAIPGVSEAINSFDWGRVPVLWEICIQSDSSRTLQSILLLQHIRVHCHGTPNDQVALELIVVWLLEHADSLKSLRSLYLSSSFSHVNNLGKLLEICKKWSVQVIFEDVDDCKISAHFTRTMREAKEKAQVDEQ